MGHYCLDNDVNFFSIRSDQLKYIFFFRQINASVQSVNDSDSPSPKKIFGDDSTKVVGSVINPNGFPKEGKILIPASGMYKDKSEESDKKKLKYQSNRVEIPTPFSCEQGNTECMIKILEIERRYQLFFLMNKNRVDDQNIF